MSPTSLDSDSLNLLTLKQVADLFQLKPRKVRELVREGLPHLRWGRAFRFQRAKVEKWLESRTASVSFPGAAPRAPTLRKRDWSRPPKK